MVSKKQGSNPSVVTLPKDIWTLVAENINFAKVTNDFKSGQIVWFTYVNSNDAAPIGLSGVKWPFNEATKEFGDSRTKRDLYFYAVSTDANITVEV